MIKVQKIEAIIVEDSEVYRNSLKMILRRSFRKYGIEIQEAENGSEFLMMIAEKRPAFVLMDIKMPVMDGIEATRKAKEKYPGLNIIALSSNDDYQIIMNMKEAGANAFLIKGLETSELISAITEVLNNPGKFILKT